MFLNVLRAKVLILSVASSARSRGWGRILMAAHGGGGVEEDQAGSSSLCPPAAEAEAAAAAAAIARAARPPRPGRDKRLGVRHPLKHRRFRAGGKAAVAAGAREVGEATTVAEATATGPPKGSDEDDEARYICGGWTR